METTTKQNPMARKVYTAADPFSGSVRPRPILESGRQKSMRLSLLANTENRPFVKKDSRRSDKAKFTHLASKEIASIKSQAT
jgi:hypothetical protein